MTRPLEFEGDYYREIGEFLGENYLNYGFTRGTEQEVDFLLEVMHLQPGQTVLDVGCGPGRHSLALARRGIRVTGIDITPRFIELAKEKATQENLPASFFVQDARALSFDNQFDGVICLCEGAFGLVGSLENHRRVLRGIRRALRPGGLFVLTALHALAVARQVQDQNAFDPYTSTSVSREPATSPNGETREVTFYTTAFTYRELLLLCQEAGFEVLHAYGCIAGQFGRKPLGLDDFEIMVVAR